MNTLKRAAVAAALLLLTPLAFACDYPKKAEIPNGAMASKDEMLAGQRAIKDYMAQMEAYLACIDQEEKDQVADIGEQSEEEKSNREAAFNKKYNAAIEEMELVAARFNEEVRAYKSQGQ